MDRVPNDVLCVSDNILHSTESTKYDDELANAKSKREAIQRDRIKAPYTKDTLLETKPRMNGLAMQRTSIEEPNKPILPEDKDYFQR